ncbi:MAG: thioredoxin family protein [Saprospiraceae bacterium]|nr:thioredoxin family protein [Saprospiraceae bacterium]
MKNPIIIFVVIAVVSVLGFGAYTLLQNSSQSDSMMKKDETMMPKVETSMEPINAMMQKDDGAMENDQMMDDKMAGSRYVQYSKSALDSASNNRRVLFFYASWCPTCKPADTNFTQNESKIPEDVTLIRVNYNDPETDQEEKELAKQYGITYQHTFVQIDNSGKEVTKWNGGQIDELLSSIK